MAILDFLPFLNPILVTIGGIITSYLVHKSKVKLNKNSVEFTKSIKALREDVSNLKTEYTKHKKRWDIIDELNEIIKNTLVYSNANELSTYLVYVTDSFVDFAGDLSIDELNDEEYLIHKLKSYRLKILGKDGLHRAPNIYIDLIKEITISDFSKYETDLVNLAKDNVNNKSHRFSLISATFHQNILSLMVRNYKNKVAE